MNKTATAILAFLAMSACSVAQERPDSLQQLTMGEGRSDAAIPVSADPVELSAIDVVAGNLRFFFNIQPTHSTTGLSISTHTMPSKVRTCATGLVLACCSTKSAWSPFLLPNYSRTSRRSR